MATVYNGARSTEGEPSFDMLERMLRVNRLVHEHANYLLITSGEMRCPECGSGRLCYVISQGDGSIVECSTPGCLRWDLSPARY
jgi:hypothetical protein